MAITCKARGTGSLSKCRFAQGSVEFSLISELYWLSIESRRAINELMKRQEEYLQTVIFRLYEQIAAVEANRVRRSEHPQESKSDSALPENLTEWVPPEEGR